MKVQSSMPGIAANTDILKDFGSLCHAVSLEIFSRMIWILIKFLYLPPSSSDAGVSGSSSL